MGRGKRPLPAKLPGKLKATRIDMDLMIEELVQLIEDQLLDKGLRGLRFIQIIFLSLNVVSASLFYQFYLPAR